MNTNNTLQTVIIVVLSLIVGFLIGRITSSVSVDDLQNVRQNSEAQTTETASGSDTSGATGTTIQAADLTPGQRKMLEMLGIDADSITITPEMVACAEAKLGAARIAEIQNGASPSFSEGVSLMACYRS